MRSRQIDVGDVCAIASRVADDHFFDDRCPEFVAMCARMVRDQEEDDDDFYRGRHGEYWRQRDMFKDGYEDEYDLW